MSTFKGLDKVITNLKNVRNAIQNDVNYMFISKSLDWISLKANRFLDRKTHHFFGSDAREWTKKIYSTFGILENNDMNSASIEFGIGRIGASNPLPEAIANGYEYDKPSSYKNADGYWTFQDVRTGMWLTIKGYEGKSFLYDAFCEFMLNRIWVKIYEQCFNRVMRRVIKK